MPRRLVEQRGAAWLATGVMRLRRTSAAVAGEWWPALWESGEAG